MKPNSRPPPRVSPYFIRQQVVFEEKIGRETGTWTSKSVSMLQNNWSFRFVRHPERVDFRIKFEGPTEEISLSQIKVFIGGGSAEESDFVEEVITDVSFNRLEARMVKDLCSFEAFKRFLNGETLSFQVRLEQESPTPHLPIQDEVAFPPLPDKKISALEGQVARLTQERNKMGLSLHKLSLTDNKVSFLDEAQATQPEVTRKYKAFKQTSRNLIFQILAGRSTEEFGEIMKNFVGRIQRRVKSNRQEKVEGLMSVMNLKPGNESDVSAAEAAYKQIVRQTGHSALGTISVDETEQLVAIIRDSDLGDLEDEEESIAFGTFVWSLSSYLFCSDSLFVNWEAFGSNVTFDRSKYQSISRRVRKGEECVLVLPMLQRTPFQNNRKRAVEDYESLCSGFICPT